MKHFFLFLSAILAFAACKTNNTATTSGDGVHFGAAIDTTGMIPYTALLEQMSQADSVDAKVFGTISAVCQAKGCWMRMVSAKDTTGTEMFVDFIDYSFFVPTNIEGKQVVVLGKAKKETTSVEDLKHFAEDEGLSQEEIDKITEPKTELKFTATGVLVL
jgi:hypothetical protein